MNNVAGQSRLASLSQYQKHVPGRLLLEGGDGPDGDVQLRSRIYPSEQLPAPAPGIPQHALIFVYGGEIEGAWRTGGGPWQSFDTWAAGHVTVRPAGLSTSLRWSAQQAVRTVSLYLAPELVEEVGLEMGMAPSRIELQNTFNARDPVLREVAETFRRMVAADRPDDALFRQTALQTLLVRLLYRYGMVSPPDPAGAGRLSLDRLHRVERFVRAHLDSDVSLDDLADEVDLSKYHFSRRFKERTGQSPYQFVIYERVRRARRLLRQTTQPLAQIALDVGFSSQSHMTRTFKNHVGVTPGQYRAAWR